MMHELQHILRSGLLHRSHRYACATMRHCQGCNNTWISASLVNFWLVFILKVILHVAHLVVGGEEVIHVDCSTLLYPVKEK
jgi:hypothetical protein